MDQRRWVAGAAISMAGDSAAAEIDGTVGRLIATILTFPGSSPGEARLRGQRHARGHASRASGIHRRVGERASRRRGCAYQDTSPRTEEAKRGVITGNATIPAPYVEHDSRKTSSGALSSPRRVSKCAGLTRPISYSWLACTGG